MRATAASAVMVGLAVLAGCSAHDGSPGGSASCAALLEYAGHVYSGYGDLVRDPATTGRVDDGVLPGCDDGNGATADEPAKVSELAGIPMARAVLVGGQLYVRRDRPFPEAARIWFQRPECEGRSAFELRGRWLTVQGPRKVRFDGDLRAPYRLDVHVTRGPQQYVGTTVTVHADEKTDPGLGPRDVKSSLWRGGTVTAEVRCDDGRFVAETLDSQPGAAG